MTHHRLDWPPLSDLRQRRLAAWQPQAEDRWRRPPTAQIAAGGTLFALLMVAVMAAVAILLEG